MTRQAAVRRIDQETSDAIVFDTALEAYLFQGAKPALLLQAAGMVIDCDLAIDQGHANAISTLTGEHIEIETYADAAHAIRRWFAQMAEPGVRH